MIVNSVKIDLTNKVKVIDLFAGIGGLSVGLQKAYKKNSIRMSVGRDDFLWGQCPDIADEDEVFFNNWEEDTVGISLPRNYQAEFDMSKNTRLAKAVLTQSIVRYFRKRKCPVQRDFIGRIEVWVKNSQDDQCASFHTGRMRRQVHVQKIKIRQARTPCQTANRGRA